MEGREVILFKKRPGTDRILATFRSEFSRRNQAGSWGMLRGPANHALVYAKVTPKVGDGFVCRADYAAYARQN
jgi:hypothetical protein